MTDDFPISMQIGPEILAKAIREHTANHRVTKWLHRLVYVIVALCVLLLLLIQQWFLALMLGAGVVAFLQLMPMMQERLSRYLLGRQYKEMAPRDDVSKIECWYDDEKLTLKTPNSEIKISWQSFIKWREMDGLFICYRNSRFMHVLPIDQLGEMHATAIRGHLQRHSVNADEKKKRKQDGSAQTHTD